MNEHALDNCPNDLASFIADYFGERDLQPEDAIARSWYRSVVQHHLDPRASAEKHILTAGEIREHQAQHEEYLAIAGQGVSGLARRVTPAGFAVLLSDEQGVTLDARLPAQRDRYTQAGLIVGARWDESVAGTNGIGTALAAAAPLTIHRQEHFLVSNFRLSCSVAPIYDAQHNLRGCLNATCLNSGGPKEAQYLTLQLVILYARLIENAAFRQRYRDRLTLSVKARDEVADLAAEQLLALDERGRVIGANHAAFAASPGELLGSRIEQLLASDLDQLLALSQGGARAVRLRTLGDEAAVEVGLRMPAGLPRRSAPPAPAKAGEHPDLARLAGADPRLQEGVRRLRKVLDKGIAILLNGETGTGKEAFARAIHQASTRRAGPFVALNCAAIPESLIESELFGYRGGSFTGASKKGMKGKLELANGGTLFLDEIGDMPAHLQTRLLRVLAEREILPLGAETPVALDVQVVSATHQDLAAMIQARGFREDLFYRLAGMTLQLPALRERSDREALVEQLLAAVDPALRLAPEARERLRAQPWPGNIRQLLNCLRYAAALAEDGLIDLDCLPAELHQPALVVATPSGALAARLDDTEASHLLAALRERQWNISAVAEHFGVARSTLYRKMKKHGIVQPNALY
ncbi:transcriptional regulator of acetoin/glycerol metabolism [Pseudomonas citronellolis]|uniref:sigma-54-dependent Fis family transcriptional regulator n=1 Tax=Pseudomonas citronellolis TaxID=53408 RepID=UPI0020A16FE6|nr:sigma-54-dependent Fis family transcriptional regulator [Pseudomonas citronellolis]MCP1645921.1 transcriptional regulator of acetoin/glycerol metabolism [Pseudomonas citronellolis]MCP1668903.1 transcriptional regulator of acetoin/glycerol metabolism [Pseudomonas citronellolis]MCP1700267.1 transcriptional regulator of acetoin/glycerol metabolism [Pseudomonas citronellolis]MCP1706685.1 transcriptional regulator of acetoin/glycerol metabolism [Pseudomonas citronellolis]MCP1800496.1 transcripti